MRNCFIDVKFFPSERVIRAGILYFLFFIFASCSIQKKISRSATQLVLKDSALTTAHVGISIFEPAENKYWFNYQGDHYFVPASNTKIPTCYAAMKYLGDSLVGFLVRETSDSILVSPSGDPSFLNDEYRNQPFFEHLKTSAKTIAVIYNSKSSVEGLGSGWAWNDYQESYMAERSQMPLYGNLITFERKDSSLRVTPPVARSPYMDEPMIQLLGLGKNFRVTRDLGENKFHFVRSQTEFRRAQIPFKTNYGVTSFSFLKDSLNKAESKVLISLGSSFIGYTKIHSQPTDSLLKPMMHRSDNFFAEQSLLMVSNELLGYMNDSKIIDTLLKTDFKDLPQKPRWADGSGLSRYNLFTPQDFVAIFNKMKNEFGMDRIKNIFPTGNEGTLTNYYKAESGYLFGKTGSLSGVVALSGFLYTRKNKLLIFSVLVNNHNNGSAAGVRRAVEKFVESLRERY